jgi:uncharacterized protein YndB with AHSA1/START domain
MAAVPESCVTVTDDGPSVRATVTLPGSTPDRVLASFTDPAILARWWGGDLATTLEPGTPYTISFPKLNRAITGQVVAYEPASGLEFTWVWDNEPPVPRRTVVVTVTQDGTGTALSVVHGPHADTGPDPGGAEGIARAEHRDGWLFFLPRLAALLSPRGTAPA